MALLLFCEFNMDTACVELKFADGSMISIDCTAVEDEVAKNICPTVNHRRNTFAVWKPAGKYLRCWHSVRRSRGNSFCTM